MGDNRSIDVEYARFRQQLITRPTRERIGIRLTQDKALAILADETAIRSLYETWKAERSEG